jgi:hypothetical protein
MIDTPMNDHDLLIRLDVKQDQLSQDIKTLSDSVIASNKDHDERLKRLERIADRVILIGTIVGGVGGVVGWIIAQIPQWLSVLKHP